jgi:fructokinase
VKKNKTNSINILQMEQLILQKTEWENMITNANKAGAGTCDYPGAMEAFKHLSNSIFE